MIDMHEERIRVLKKGFTESIENERIVNEKRMEELKEELQVKYEKKLEAQKTKMKEKITSVKEKNEKKTNQKLEEMFNKMNLEFEQRNGELYNILVEKDGIIKSLERKMTQYQIEIDKWKDMYYAKQNEPALIHFKEKEENRKDLIEKDPIQKEEMHEENNSYEIKREEESLEKLKTNDIQEKSEEFDHQEKKLILNNSEKGKENRDEPKPILENKEEKQNSIEEIKEINQEIDVTEKTNVKFDGRKNRYSKQTLKVKEEIRCDAETMTDYVEENKSGWENLENNKELEELVGKAEEKAQGIVNRDVEMIRFYQSSLVKCLGKLKEYQILIQKFSNEF